MRPRCRHRGELVSQRPRREPPSFFNAATKRTSWRNELNLGGRTHEGAVLLPGSGTPPPPPPRLVCLNGRRNRLNSITPTIPIAAFSWKKKKKHTNQHDQ